MPETSILGGRRRGGDEDEASGGAIGAITAKDGQGSKNMIMFSQVYLPYRISTGRTGPDRF